MCIIISCRYKLVCLEWSNLVRHLDDGFSHTKLAPFFRSQVLPDTGSVWLLVGTQCTQDSKNDREVYRVNVKHRFNPSSCAPPASDNTVDAAWRVKIGGTSRQPGSVR